MTTRTLVRIAGWTVFATVAACGGQDNRPAEWSYISPAIIEPNCATSSCHSRLTAVAGLDLSTPAQGYHDLLKQQTVLLGMPAARPLVSPGYPDSSRVVNMLRAREAKRMPPDRPLAEADIDLIERWILEGAANN